MLDCTIGVSTKTISHEHQTTFEVCIEVATIDWSQHPHMSSQQNKSMTTTSHFDMFLHIQQ